MTHGTSSIFTHRHLLEVSFEDLDEDTSRTRLKHTIETKESVFPCGTEEKLAPKGGKSGSKSGKLEVDLALVPLLFRVRLFFMGEAIFWRAICTKTH